jgi:hypothetical protein
MNDSAFKSGWAALLNGFPNSSQSYTKESMKVYWSSLRNIPDDLWQRGVQKCLTENQFFPTIHELGAASCGETKEHMEDRCDPLRFKQNYQVRIEAVSWEENLLKALQSRAQIEQRSKQILPAPKRDDVIQNLREQISSLKEEKRLLELEIIRLCRVISDKPKITVDDRKRLLFEQAQQLGATVDASLVRKVIESDLLQ